MIWTWNGREFEFVTDVLGVAPLGASDGEGSYFPVDHDEYVQIPRRRAEAARRPLRDPHHRGAERGLVHRPGPTHRGRPSRRRRDLHERKVQVAAVPGVPAVLRRSGASIRAAARRWRGQRRPARCSWRATSAIPTAFPRTELGTRRSSTRWSSISAARRLPRRRAAPERLGRLARRQHLPRRLAGTPERADAALSPDAGRRRPVGHGQPDMGMPAGKPKTIAVPLHWLSASRKLRIVTDLCVYWDEIFLSETQRRRRRATADPAPRFRRPALPRLLRVAHRPRAQAARHLLLRPRGAGIFLESDARALHAIRRRRALCSASSTTAS